MRGPLAASAAALLGALSAVVAAAPSAAADVPCEITGFTPTVVAVGLSPTTRTFGVRTRDCAGVEGWDIDLIDTPVYVYQGARQSTFVPQYLENADAGRYDAVVTVNNSDYVSTERAFPDGFRLVRRTSWNGFNASPEPVRKGARISITGKLSRANWDARRYQGYGGRRVSVDFKAAGTKVYTRVKVAYTDRSGYLRTSVTASKDGAYRARYSGNSVSGSAVTGGDYVDVR